MGDRKVGDLSEQTDRFELESGVQVIPMPIHQINTMKHEFSHGSLYLNQDLMESPSQAAMAQVAEVSHELHETTSLRSVDTQRQATKAGPTIDPWNAPHTTRQSME